MKRRFSNVRLISYANVAAQNVAYQAKYPEDNVGVTGGQNNSKLQKKTN